MMHRMFLVLPLVSLFGCGASDAPPLAVVTGKVLLDGEPAKGLTIEFHPDNSAGTSGPMSLAISNPDGTFHLYTSVGGDGAVIGTHKVVIKCPFRLEGRTPVVTGDGVGSAASGKAPEPVKKADASDDCKLALKYEDPTKTPLRHVVPEKGISDLVLQATTE